MYTYKISDDITKKVNEIGKEETKKKSVNDLLNELNNINNKFSSNNKIELPDEIKLDKLKPTEKSGEEIKFESENALNGYKKENINKINDEMASKETELSNNKNNFKSQVEEDKLKINSYYDNAKSSASDQALTRGLARSSIIVNQLDAFNNNQINDFKELDQQLSSTINKINSELSSLTTQKEKALNDFNIEYAVKLQEKIGQLTQDLNKKNDEVSKYNNDISLKEAAYNKELKELESKLNSEDWNNDIDLAEIYGKYGQNVINKIKQDQVYSTTKNRLSKLPVEEALSMLQNDEVKNALGEDNFKKLLNELKK